MLSHEKQRVAIWVIIERTEQAISELLIKRSRLEAEGREPRVRASAFDRVLFCAIHQIGAVALAAEWFLYREDANVKPLPLKSRRAIHLEFRRHRS
jgi:hypothetical protein